jgi:hypothetical protein
MKNFQIVIIYQNDFYIVVLYGKPLHFECISNVERLVEPSISPDKWPTGVIIK